MRGRVGQRDNAQALGPGCALCTQLTGLSLSSTLGPSCPPHREAAVCSHPRIVEHQASFSSQDRKDWNASWNDFH